MRKGESVKLAEVRLVIVIGVDVCTSGASGQANRQNG